MRVLHVEPLRYGAELRARLAEVGRVDYVECATHGEYLEALAAAPYEAVFVRLGLATDARALAAAPALRYVVTPTTGLDHIDVAAAEARGVTVISLRGETEFLSTIKSTAEHTWALLLALVRKLPAAVADVQGGRWRREPFLADELDGKVLGILGYGRLGKIVAGYGVAFGMRVLANDIDVDAFAGAPEQVEVVSLERLLTESDVVSVHLPLDASTCGFLSAERLAAMKPGAFLVNTARGELVDEGALLAALEAGKLAGAALDVLAGDGGWGEDALPTDHGLVRFARQHENLLISPHVGGYGLASINRTRGFVTEGFLRAMGL